MKRSFTVAPMVVLLIVALVLVLSACSSAPSPAPTTAPAQPTPPAGSTPANPSASPAAQAAAAQAPKYGGTLNLATPSDVTTFDTANEGGPVTGAWEAAQSLWEGDWTRGPAGGYGTKQTDWAVATYDLFSMKAGFIAQSWKYSVDSAKQEATIVYEIRPGVHWAVNPASPASKTVGGRTVTVQDVITSIQQDTAHEKGYIYRGYPQLRNKVNPVQTGPMEITIKVPAADLVTALSALGNKLRIFPVEIRKLDTSKWQNYVGTGPFMMTDYVAGSTFTLKRNPNYWMKDPIGPGKGNQLPYLDGVKLFIMPDPSTRLTAFRTGKIDEIDTLAWEDAAQINKEFPKMPSVEGNYFTQSPTYMRTDKPPFNDVRVRRALMMATDFNAIKQSLNGGKGIIITYPYEYYKGYDGLYVGVDDKDLPASVKQLFTYNPEGAKKLLADAGHPNGLKTTVLLPASDSSYYEAIASMWKKIGVDLTLEIKDPPTIMHIVNSKASYDGMVSGPGKGPATVYYVGTTLTGAPGFSNTSFINDPIINNDLVKIRSLAVTDTAGSMQVAKQMATHVLDQAYAIPRPSYRTSTFWWPWIKSYTGESAVGFFDLGSWDQFVWLDQHLKQSMGH